MYKNRNIDKFYNIGLKICSPNAIYIEQSFSANTQTQATLRCSQPWLGGIVGGPGVPAHQPRQIIMGIKPKGPLFLLHEVGRTEAFCAPTGKHATGAPCGKLHC